MDGSIRAFVSVDAMMPRICCVELTVLEETMTSQTASLAESQVFTRGDSRLSSILYGLRQIQRKPLGLISLVLIIVVIIMAVFAPVLATIRSRRTPPTGSRVQLAGTCSAPISLGGMS
jgi:hypothetical protein